MGVDGWWREVVSVTTSDGILPTPAGFENLDEHFLFLLKKKKQKTKNENNKKTLPYLSFEGRLSVLLTRLPL